MSWERATLGEVAHWSSGGTPQAKHPAYYGGSIPWSVIGDLNDGMVTGTRSSITQAGLEISAAKVVPAGTLLVAMYGSIGKLGIAGVDMATNQAIAAARVGKRIELKFLFYYLLSQRTELSEAGKGATQRNISQTILKLWPVPIPPLEEQRRIVSILEGHLAHLDAADAAIRNALARSRALVTSSLANSVRAASGEGPTETIGAHAERVEYGTSARCDVSSGVGDIPVLRMGNIREGRIDWNGLKFLPGDHADAQRLMLRCGDLVFNRTNSAELVGKTAVIEEDRQATFASYLIRVRFAETIIPDWASMSINSPQGRAYVASCVTQQVGQANVNGTKLKAFPIPVPSMSRQRELVAQHREIVSTSGRLNHEGKQALARSAALRRSLLAAAFSGRLAASSTETSKIAEMVVA